MPRTYRGRDIMWWLDRIGRLDERCDEVDDLVRARHVPSPQLVGTPDRATLDLNALTARGAELVGRLAAVRDGTALFSGSLRNVCNLADLKLVRLLDTIDAWAAARRPRRRAPVARPEPTRVARLAAARRSTSSPTATRPCSGRPGYRSDLLVARRCRCSTARASCATTAASSPTRPGSTASAATSCAAASRASSTAPRTTRATSSRHLVGAPRRRALANLGHSPINFV